MLESGGDGRQTSICFVNSYYCLDEFSDVLWECDDKKTAACCYGQLIYLGCFRENGQVWEESENRGTEFRCELAKVFHQGKGNAFRRYTGEQLLPVFFTEIVTSNTKLQGR